MSDDDLIEEIDENRRLILASELTTDILYDLGSNKKDIFNNYEFNNEFFEDVYDYYYKNGLYTIILTNITEILFLIFGLFFGTFIFILLDWSKILQCGKDNHLQDCGDISIYISKNNIPNLFSISFLLILTFITSYKIVYFIFNFKKLLKIHKFYKNILEISDNELHISPWKNIIDILSKYSRYTIYEITNKILIKENYKIALLNEKVFDMNYDFYSKQLELNIEYIILNDLDNLNEKTLKFKFILFGIFNLLFSIFIFIFILIYFFISNVDEYYSNAQTLGSRRYSIYAKTKLRKYNELKHFFEKRINKSIKYAYIYIKQFPYPILEIIAKFVALISGTFIGSFLILSILDESILLYVRYLDRSILFYTGIIGIISSTARSFIINPEDKIYNPRSAIDKLDEYIHIKILYNLPNDSTENLYYVKNKFLKLFKYNIILFFYDLFGVLYTPFLLIFVFPYKTDKIIEFIKTNTIYVDKVGKICKFSQFNKNNKNILMEKSISIFEENHK